MVDNYYQTTDLNRTDRRDKPRGDETQYNGYGGTCTYPATAAAAAVMASASVGTSPNALSPYELEFPPYELEYPPYELEFPAAAHSAGDADDAFWTAISNPGNGAASAGGGFTSSPASHNLGSSWAVVGDGGQLSPGLASPLNQDLGQLSPFAEQGGHAAFGDGSAGLQVSPFTQGFGPEGLHPFAAGDPGFGVGNQFNGKGCGLFV